MGADRGPSGVDCWDEQALIIIATRSTTGMTNRLAFHQDSVDAGTSHEEFIEVLGDHHVAVIGDILEAAPGLAELLP